MLHQFETDGRIWLRGALSDDDLRTFDQATSADGKAGARLASRGSLREVLSQSGSLARALSGLQEECRPVRIVSFDKSRGRNWGVPWHQDRVIAVRDKVDVAGFNNWTRKSGVWHCEPPFPILEKMLFVRVHLDDTDEANGAMEIALTSHSFGPVRAEQAEELARRCASETCVARRGDVLVLKMAMLHRSLPSKVASSRRVLRIAFANEALPQPLEWAV